MEAAMEWHCTLDRWQQIHPSYRAKMTAVYLYRNLRESYVDEKMAKEAEGKSKHKDGGSSYENLMSQMK